MPKVGNVDFPYTEMGMRDASVYSGITGSPMRGMREGGAVKKRRKRKGYKSGGLLKPEMKANVAKPNIDGKATRGKTKTKYC